MRRENGSVHTQTSPIFRKTHLVTEFCDFDFAMSIAKENSALGRQSALSRTIGKNRTVLKLGLLSVDSLAVQHPVAADIDVDESLFATGNANLSWLQFNYREFLFRTVHFEGGTLQSVLRKMTDRTASHQKHRRESDEFHDGGIIKRDIHVGMAQLHIPPYLRLRRCALCSGDLLRHPREQRLHIGCCFELIGWNRPRLAAVLTAPKTVDPC
jgi:hypothetical protein